MKIVSNVNNPNDYKLDGRDIIKAKEYLDNNIIELNNGVFLRDMLDGRYYDSDDDLYEYAEVFEVDDSYLPGEPELYEGGWKTLGFVEL